MFVGPDSLAMLRIQKFFYKSTVMSKPVSLRAKGHISGGPVAVLHTHTNKIIFLSKVGTSSSHICPHIASMTSIYFCISIATAAMILPQT